MVAGRNKCVNKCGKDLTTYQDSEVKTWWCPDCWKEVEVFQQKVAKIVPGVQSGSVRMCGEMDKIYKDTDWTLAQLKELRGLIEQLGVKGNEWLQTATNGLLCVPDFIFTHLDKKIKEKENEDPPPTKTKIKLSGCQCSDKDKEFEVDLKGETYDENKDLIACFRCWSQDKYSQFTQKKFDSYEVGTNRQVAIAVIKGAKNQDEPTTEKCSDCKQDKKTDKLTTIQDNGKDIKVCADCKQKRDNPQDDPNRKPNNPNDDPNKPNPENEKKWGKDFGQLKPTQREGRMKTQNSWSQGKAINFVCLHCQKSFPMDKSIENYLEARTKAQNELNTHKSSCPLKNSEEGKNKLQKYWDEKRKSKTRIIKTCEKCWGKVLWDKSIKDVETARKQALSDLKYHQDKECGTEGKKKIAIYHSPNSGGNEHAPIDNSLTDDGVYNEDNEGEIYQEQNPNKGKGLSGGMIALIVVGAVALVGGTIFLLTRNKNKKRTKITI